MFNQRYTKLNCTSKITSGLQIRGQTKQSSSVKCKGVLHYKIDSHIEAHSEYMCVSGESFLTTNF